MWRMCVLPFLLTRLFQVDAGATNHATGQGFAVSKAAVSNIEIQVLPGIVSIKNVDDWGVWGSKRKPTLKAIVV